MNLFDQLVDQAVRTRSDLAPLRPAVEKELLHHDILREMSEAGLLSHLVFIGGTCLRACYGSQRLSEDLDFTGGVGFSRENLEGFVLEDSGLQIAFHSEMRRFLPPESVSQTIANPEYWEYIVGEINAAAEETLRFLEKC